MQALYWAGGSGPTFSTPHWVFHARISALTWAHSASACSALMSLGSTGMGGGVGSRGRGKDGAAGAGTGPGGPKPSIWTPLLPVPGVVSDGAVLAGPGSSVTGAGVGGDACVASPGPATDAAAEGGQGAGTWRQRHRRRDAR